MPTPYLARCPFCGNRDLEVDPRDFFARVLCNSVGCNAVGPISCYAVGPEWREIVVASAASKWNDAVCRYAGWVKE